MCSVAVYMAEEEKLRKWTDDEIPFAATQPSTMHIPEMRNQSANCADRCVLVDV